MKTRLPCFLVAGLIAACCLIGVSRAAVFSIDFGSEWMKVALVKPGVPMEIVLNKESKRKTAAVVALRKDERLFGDAALNTAVKFPKSAYRYLQLLIGQKFDSPLVQKYKEWFPFYDLKKDEERGTVLFQHDKDTVYSVEELVGMLFNYSRQLVEDYAGIPIKDVVITVPPFFTQAQRRSVLYAASLVGLSVVQLMGDSAGAGLNYGVFRQQSFNTTPQYIMLYDMGASSTVASIIEYRRVQVKEGSRANLHPQLLVKGVGYDRLLGGFEIDTRLQQHLAKVFEGQKKSTQSSVYESPRAMAKLLKEAKRLKQVLSANTDHFAQIEGLHEDIDFRAKVSRAELEKICSDLFDRVGHPVREALESADMTMDEIDNVIIIGGGTRVPKVQEILLQAVGKPELGKNLNADEAVALGAVYQGAGHSKMFRVKKFLVKEGTVFPIQVSFSRVTRSEDGDEVITKTVKRTLFQRGNAYPQKKVLTFNRYSDDFPFQVFYGELDFLSNEELSYIGRLNISEVFMSGVSDALSSHQDGEAKGIKAHFRMDESGLLMLDYAESIFEYPDGVKPEEQSTLSKIGSTISSFFGGGSSSKEEDKKEEQDEGEEVAADGDGNETTTTTSDSHSTKEERTEPPQPDTEAEQEATDEENEQTEAEAEAGETESERGEETSEEDSQSRSEEEESSEEEEGEGAEQGEESEEEEKEAERGEEPEGEEKGAEQPSREEIPQEEAVPQEDGQTAEAGEEASSEDTVNATNTTNGTSSTAGKGKKDKGSKKDKQQPPEVKENTVKINLTADVTVLDLPSPSQASATVSTNKLAALQQRDDDKVANEKAKNSLESHIFETKDAMYSEAVVTVTTAEQRETILAALTDAGNWLEDDGYFAETSVYKSKLRELKRASRAVFKRVAEMQLRPKLINHLNNSLNVSRDFLSRMKNLSTELQIFTDVEMTTLETLIEETEEWMAKMIAQQEATPAYEEPVLLSSEIEEQSKRLDREILYLLNKLRSHPPPRARNTTTNATNSSTASNTTKANSSKDETPSSEKATPTKDGTTPTKEEPSTIEEEQPEILELPETADSAQTVTDDEEPPLTDSSTELPSQSSEEKHQEL